MAIDGRLDWSEWQDKETGKNRQKVEIVAENIQFLGGRDDAGGGNGGGSVHAPERRPGRLVRLRSAHRPVAEAAARRTTTSRSELQSARESDRSPQMPRTASRASALRSAVA